MPLLKDSRITEDSWTFIDDTDDIPPSGNIAVSLERLKSHFDTLVMRNGELGVRIDNDADANELAPYIEKLSLIALHFPAFTDGRAYSQARIITTHFNYTGELRATGNVLADQGVFMSQCGFDAFEIDKRQPPHLWINIANTMSLAYQRGYRARSGFSPRSVQVSRADHQAAG